MAECSSPWGCQPPAWSVQAHWPTSIPPPSAATPWYEHPLRLTLIGRHKPNRFRIRHAGLVLGDGAHRSSGGTCARRYAPIDYASTASHFGPVVCMTRPRAPAVRRIRGSVFRLARHLRVYGRRGWPTDDPCTGYLPSEHGISDSNICFAFRCFACCCTGGVLPAGNAAKIRTSALGQPNSRPQTLP